MGPTDRLSHKVYKVLILNYIDDKMIKSIRIKNKIVYYKEIINPHIFMKLYLNEKLIKTFSSKITTKTDRPFTTFHSKERRHLHFKEGDILVLRLLKKNKEAQLISKIFKWGKIHIPKEIINLLNIKNCENIKFEILSRNKKLNLRNKCDRINLQMLRTHKIKTIPRLNNYITIYCRQKIPITIPRFIKIDKNLIELFYLIHGDGHYQNKLYFSNKVLELHKFVLEKFEDIFKIPKDLWKARIIISDLNFKDYAKHYWKNKLNLDEKQFYNTSKSTLRTNKEGNLRMIIDFTIVSLIFKFIFNKLQSLNKINSLHALNGLLYAEGGAQINKKGLHKITLSFNKNEKEMFKRILDNLNIKYKIEQSKNFVISGWNNQYSFFKIFLSKDIIPFNVHNQRRHYAINGFLNHSFTKTMIKYLSILKQNNQLSTKEFSTMLEIRKDSTLRTIRKKQYLKFINLKKRNNYFIISITKEGLIFLNLINNLQKIKEDFMEDKLPFEKIERKVYIKKEATTDPSFGCKPDERSVSELINYGVININKPSGPT